MLVSIEKTYQTLKRVSDHISKHLGVLPKYFAARRILNSLLVVWKCHQTRSFMFDILPQFKPDFFIFIFLFSTNIIFSLNIFSTRSSSVKRNCVQHQLYKCECHVAAYPFGPKEWNSSRIPRKILETR